MHARAYLSCTLKSSSISSSSQLSSHSLSPPDLAAPGAVPPKCARSVCESSQSKAELSQHIVRKAGQHAASPPASEPCRRRSFLRGHTGDCELLELVVLFEDAEMWDVIVLGMLYCRRGALNRLRCG